LPRETKSRHLRVLSGGLPLLAPAQNRCAILRAE
jgi:hypothetical protein